MAVRSSRSQRVCSIKQYEKGYYRRLIDTETEDVEKESTLILTSDDVYEVERLIEQRMIKGKVYYLVLWKNYSKEEATWEPESEITEAAVRLYHEPQPPIRAILDAVASVDWCKGPDRGLPCPDVIFYFHLSSEEGLKRSGYGEERYVKKSFQEVSQ
uniref:Chromo domain-containing protein n=1 Tax=Amphimedon queenslandica TaxID=400682 RepID=A0A1X7TRP4_AMPQE